MTQRIATICLAVVLAGGALAGVLGAADAHEEAPPPDERAERLEISTQLRRTQASLVHTRRMVSNARALSAARGAEIRAALETAEGAMCDAQAALTRGRAEGE